MSLLLFRQLRLRLRALRGQAVTHIFFAMLIATVSLIIISVLAYREITDAEITQEHASLRTYFGDRLERVGFAWDNQADDMRARFEFSRILEQQDDKRWPKFTAYLNAQRVFSAFPTLLILNGDGEVLYRYGVIAHALDAQLVRSSDWHFDAALGELYRVLVRPIWLGSEGQGQLVLLKPVDNAALVNMAIPDTILTVTWLDRRVATSQDNPPTWQASQQVLNIGTRLFIAAQVSWPHATGPSPVLLAYREVSSILPFSEFLYGLFAAITVIALLLWLTLGRWLAATVRRLEGVDRALEDYASQAPHATIDKHLIAARSRRDEINNLAEAVGELMHVVDAREREQATYLDTLALLEEAVLELDCDGNIRHASPGWNSLTHTDTAVGKNLLDFIHPADAAVLHAQCLVLRSGEKNNLLFRVRLAGPNPEQQNWIECRFFGFRDEAGEIAGIRGVLRDITQSYLHEKQISHMALHDALTGLPNRVLLEDRLKIALRMATRSNDKVCVCFIDIDHFKNVNDTLGHKAGDRLLVLFANLLRGELRAGDTLARWGGDEFVLLLPGMQNDQDVREVTSKISAVIQQPLLLDGVEMRMTFSLGAAIYPDDAENSDVLFSQADRAMFYAKAQGRNQSCFFGDMSSKGIGKKELYVQNRLATAINNRQIQAWFQPIVCARTNACIGLEVLARWQDEELGWISPATFIPIAENIGLIRELGEQVWQASLAMQEYCRAAGMRLRFSVNVSKRQLFIPAFTELALEESQKRGIPSHEIMWEVTESVALRDVEHAAERLHELKAAGFKIAIDDFGTGYSSLSQLHEIHADELKIDISFVRRIHEPAGLSLVQAIIHIASALGLRTVAEGVEDAAAATLLRELGVDYLQGYHFARPLPRDDFLAWLEKHQAHVESALI